MSDVFDLVRYQYGMSEADMFELFGTDSETQARMLGERPDLRQAVSDMESYLCTNIRDFSR